MLGKFKSIFAKEALEVRIGAVSDVMAELSDKGQKERLEASKATLDAETRKLRVILEELSVKRADDNYVNVLKDRFCEKGLKSLALHETGDAFVETLSSAMQEISSISFKEFRHLQAFKDDMARIASQIKTMEEKLEEFRRAYLSSSQKKINDVLSLTETVKEKEAALTSMNTELQQIERAIPFIKEALESDERKLSEISNKIAAAEQEIREMASSLESERSIIKQRIGTELGSVDKLLKKVHHENPKKFMLLQDYIANPGDAFIADESLQIRTILEELKPLIKKEELEKYDKLLEVLRNIDFFDSLRQQYMGLTNKMQEIREARAQDLGPLEKEKGHLLASIEENRTEISQLLEKRAARTEEKERLIQALARERALLAEKLQDVMQREVKLI